MPDDDLLFSIKVVIGQILSKDGYTTRKISNQKMKLYVNEASGSLQDRRFARTNSFEVLNGLVEFLAGTFDGQIETYAKKEGLPILCHS